MSGAVRSQWCEVNGARLSVEAAGEGPPVLLLPGLGYASWCFEALQAALCVDHLTLAVDHRGTGRSEQRGPYTLEQMADDAAGVLEALGLERAHVIAHSMGGYVAQLLALRAPHRVRSLVLMGTSRGGPGALPVPASTLAAWGAAAHLDAEGFARATMPLSFAPGWSERNPARYEALLAARLRYPTRGAVWQAQFSAAAAFLARGVDGREVRVPTLVMHGAEDRVVPWENGRHLAAGLPGSRLVTVDGAGHNFFLEAPERTVAAIRRALPVEPGGDARTHGRGPAAPRVLGPRASPLC